MDNNKNLQNLENSLVKLKVEPDPVWQDQTKHNLETFIDNFNPLDMNTADINVTAANSFWNKQTLTLLASFTGALVFLSVFGFIAYNEMFNSPITPTQITDESEKKEILANVLKNNSVEALTDSNDELNKVNTGVNPTDPNTQNNSPSTINSRLAPITDINPENPTENPLASLIPLIPSDYSYRYTKTEYEKGDAATKCFYEDTSFPQYTSEYYEFFSNSGIYTKRFSENSDGLIDYSITRYDTNISDRLVYKGGDYAVRLNYSNNYYYIPSSYPVVSYPASYSVNSGQVDNLIERYFGYGAEVLGTEEDDGVEYYIVKRSYEAWSCDADKIIYLTWINADNFQIEKYETYLDDETSEDNLVSRTETSVETKKINFGEVESLFSFEYSVNIRELDTENYPQTSENQRLTALNTYLNENNIKLLSIASFRNDYSYAPLGRYFPSGWDYSVDPNFYPVGDHGQLLYDLAVYGSNTKRLPKTEVYSYLYRGNYYGYYDYNNSASANENIYSISTEDEKIINANFSGDIQDDLETQDIKLKVKTKSGNTVEVNAAVYQKKQYDHHTTSIVSYPTSYGLKPVSYPASYPASYPQYGTWCDPGECYSLKTLIIFEYEGHKYSLFSYNSMWINLEDLLLEEV